MRNRTYIDLLGSDLCIKSLESETPGEHGILTQARGSRGGEHSESFFLNDPKGPDRVVQLLKQSNLVTLERFSRL